MKSLKTQAGMALTKALSKQSVLWDTNAESVWPHQASTFYFKESDLPDTMSFVPVPNTL